MQEGKMEDKSKDLARMKELNELLNRASRAYYMQDTEIMSNFEYDALYDELKDLEERTGTVLSGSPTVRVGYEVVSELPKEEHEFPMLSLDKTKEVGQLVSWLGDQKAVLSWKMDGLTIVLTYEGGELIKAVTRGNGHVGEIVTGNAKVFQNVPHRISFKGKLVLRGEAVIRYSDFNEINEKLPEGEARYKNPRNLCSGSVRQLNSQVTASRNVYLYAFALVYAQGADIENSAMARFDWLSSQGFDVVEHRLVDADTLPAAVEDFAARIQDNDFPSDGLVLLLEDIAYGQSLGTTAKFPRNAIAFKWADEVEETHLRSVEWSASRTGLINPVAIFDPVELEGTTVTRASLHNVSIVKALQLGLGDRLQVYKANMIIPQIAENLTRSDTLEIPDTCPVCGAHTTLRDENGVMTLYCTNPACLAKHAGLLVHFTSRDAFNIEGLSEATLEKFIQMGKLKEDDQSKLNKLIDQLRTDEKSPAEKKAAAVELEQLCENLKFIPENKSVHKSIVKIENFLCSLAYRRSFNLSGYADSGKANDVNAINYDRVLGNARRAGSLKKYYLACDRFLMDDITMDSGRRLKKSDWDLVLKMTACCMLELSRKGKEKVLRTKAVCVNESDFIDWLMLEKNCGKSKLLQFRYHGETLFEHPSFSGDENRKMQKKGINTKKIRLAQRWLEDSGFEILCDDPETNVIQNYLNLHPEGRVFVDNGSGKPMTEPPL